MAGISYDNLRFTASDLADYVGVSRQRVSILRMVGAFEPSDPAGPVKSRAAWHYTLRDAASLVFRQRCVALGFYGEALDDCCRIIQHATEPEMKRAWLVAVRTGAGFLRHIAIPDDRIEYPAYCEMFGFEGKLTGRALIRALERDNRLASKLTFYQIAVEILRELHEDYVEGKLKGTEIEAG